MNSMMLWIAIAAAILQTISSQAVEKGCDGEADVVFLIDASDSCTQTDFDRSVDFVRSVVSKLDIGLKKTRVGLSTITDSGQSPVFLDNYGDKQYLLNAIDTRARYDNVRGDLATTLQYVRTHQFIKGSGARDKIPDVLVIIASEKLNMISDGVKNEVRQLREQGVFIIMIVYGDTVNRNTMDDRLMNIVSDPLEHNRFALSSSSDLNAIQTDFMKRICGEIPACAGVADIAFIIDSSGSVGPNNWLRILSFVTKVIDNLYVSKDGVSIAALVFSRNVDLVFNLNKYHTKAEIIKAIEKIQFQEGSGTNTPAALTAMRERIFGSSGSNRLNVRDIAIVITDGASTEHRELTVPAARKAHDAGIRVFAIGVGVTTGVFRDELLGIGSDPDSDHVFNVNDFATLDKIEETLVKRTCREAMPSCDKKIDLVFAIDASGSIDEPDFQRILNFVRDLVSQLEVDSSKARVGFVVYSDNPKLIFHLDTHDTFQGMSRDIVDTKYLYGKTNTAAMFRYVRETMFTTSHGRRDGVDDVLVVITDGGSDDPTATINEARKTRDSGIEVLVMGIGDSVRMYEMEGMASHPKTRNVFMAEGYLYLFQATDLMRSTLCDVTNDCESNPCHNGGTCVDRMNMYYCKCPSPYTGRDCQRTCKHNADIVFALDASGSIGKENFFVMEDYVRDVIYGVNVDGSSRVGVLTFGSDAQLNINLNEHSTTRTLVNALNLRYTGGTTNTAAAIRTIRTQMFHADQGDRAGYPNVVIILTDGKSDNTSETLAEALAARKAGIHITAIGVGASIGMSELKGIATDPDDKSVVIVKDFNALTGTIDRMLDKTCNDVSECDSSPCQNGGTCVDDIESFTCKCKDGFTGITCQRSCDNAADVVFVVDSSGSIEKERFGAVRDFVKGVIRELDVDSGKVRVGIIYYSDDAKLHYPLAESAVTEDILYAVDTMEFMGKATNTAGALAMLRKRMFNGLLGDRPEVPNYAILITDGVPNIERRMTVQEAINARIDGVHMLLATIGHGLTHGLNYLNLQGIASEPIAANFFNVRSYKNVSTMGPKVVAAMCNDVNECASRPCQNGGTCYDGLSTYICGCTDRYTGLNCERRCMRQRDVAFLVDVSASLEKYIDMMVSFMKAVVQGLSFKYDRTRVGFVTFARSPDTRFHLDEYTSQRDVLNAVTLSDVGYGTNIAAALRHVKDNVFRASKGDRVLVDNICILLSDGRATLDSANTELAATEAKNDDINLYTVVIGDSIGVDTMNKIASRPQTSYAYSIKDRSQTESVAERMLDQLCT